MRRENILRKKIYSILLLSDIYC